MKTIITHLRPHLDDICAVWLMRRYWVEGRDAVIDFIANDVKGGKTEPNPDFVYIGIGRGQFDEHKGDIGECATSLVFAFLRPQLTIDAEELRALEKMVAWTLREDTGELNTVAYRDFTIPAFLEVIPDSTQAMDLGFAVLDALLLVQKNVVKIENAWKQRKEFPSRFGKAVAIRTDARKVDAYAYARGFPLLVIMDPNGTYHSFRAAADSDIDLTSVYAALREREPQASWYFHHSKKLLICGGDHGTTAVHSSLSFDELIELVK